MLCCGLHSWKNNSSCSLVTSQMEQTSPRAEFQPQRQSQLELEPLRYGPSEIHTVTAKDIKLSTARQRGQGPAKRHFPLLQPAPPSASHHFTSTTWPPNHKQRGYDLAILPSLISYLSHECKSLVPSEAESSEYAGTTSSGLVSPTMNDNPLQYSCLGDPMDRGAWRATVHGVAQSRT